MDLSLSRFMVGSRRGRATIDADIQLKPQYKVFYILNFGI